MRSLSWFFLLLISILVLAGCAPVSPTIQPTQELQLPSPTNLPVTETLTLTPTQTQVVIETPSSTVTQTPVATLTPDSAKETMQPLLQDPMNCAGPCFLGITPGKTSIDKARAFFAPLGFKHREGTDPNSGKDFYSIAYETSIGRASSLTLFVSNNLVESIEITPEIIKQQKGSPREWIAYSPETLIKKYGKPSRVELGLDLGQVNTTIVMIMYFDKIDLIALYSGYEAIPGHPHSPQFCPFTFPFNHVRFWMGANPPNPPQMPGIPVEIATSLTVDQFAQLMLGDPQNACFKINGDTFK